MENTARLLPERLPDVGELVEVRSRRWLVEAVEPESGRVNLACADDDAQGEYGLHIPGRSRKRLEGRVLPMDDCAN